jgi:hypothetical protein
MLFHLLGAGDPLPYLHSELLGYERKEIFQQLGSCSSAARLGIAAGHALSFTPG